MTTKPLFVPLCTAPYLLFERGVKTVEVREWKGRWNRTNVRYGRAVVLSRGYSTPDRLQGIIRRVGISWVGVAHLPPWAIEGASLGDLEDRFVPEDGPVIAFEVVEVKPLAR